MKITTHQLRRLIREMALKADRIYLDHGTSAEFDLDYDNRGQEWIIYPEDFARLKRMTQYDTKHQEIFSRYERAESTLAIGTGYGWWDLGA